MAESAPKEGTAAAPADCPAGQNIRNGLPTRRELYAVVALLCLLFVFNLATCRWYPAVWYDEVSFSEPAINFVHTGAFTTTVWQYQPLNTFPTLNCPLYSLSLVPWMSIVGTSLPAVRSWNYLLMAVAAFLLWCVSWRFRLVTSARLRIWLIVFIHLGYGMSFSYRCSRPDILGMVSLLFLLLALGAGSSPVRNLAVVVLAALTVWIGLQVALFAWCACFAAAFFLRWIRWRDIALIAAGMAAAAGLLLLFFHAKGVLSFFLPMVASFLGKHYAHASHLSLINSVLGVVRNTGASYVTDFSTDILLLGLALWVPSNWKRMPQNAHRWITFCIALVFAVPLLFNLVGNYGFYYSYLRFIPAALVLFGVWSKSKEATGAEQKPIRLSYVPQTSLFLAASVGLPLRLSLMLAFSTLSPSSSISDTIRANVKPEDVVYSDYAAFFDVKPLVKTVYDFWSSGELHQTPEPGRAFTSEEKASVSVLIVRNDQSAFFTNFFGGSWEPVTASFGDQQNFDSIVRLPMIGPRIRHYSEEVQTERYPIRIFRRTSVN